MNRINHLFLSIALLWVFFDVKTPSLDGGVHLPPGLDGPNAESTPYHIVTQVDLDGVDYFLFTATNSLNQKRISLYKPVSEEPFDLSWFNDFDVRLQGLALFSVCGYSDTISDPSFELDSLTYLPEKKSPLLSQVVAYIMAHNESVISKQAFNGTLGERVSVDIVDYESIAHTLAFDGVFIYGDGDDVVERFSLCKEYNQKFSGLVDMDGMFVANRDSFFLLTDKTDLEDLVLNIKKSFQLDGWTARSRQHLDSYYTLSANKHFPIREDWVIIFTTYEDFLLLYANKE